MHRWQELRRARRIPLLMFFVDVKMTYSSVDRERRWVVLARFRVPMTMLIIIGQFHESMRARVRTDDGEHYEWHDVTQGLRHGCVLSPILRNVFFAAQRYIHTQLAKMSFDKIFDLTAGVYFIFYYIAFR